MTSKQTSISK